MSNPESFIDEVTEEVRRDRLYALMRKWGWVGIAGVVAIVGGSAYVEITKAQAAKKAQAFGDAILAAVETDGDIGAALGEITGSGDASAILALIAAADAQTGVTSTDETRAKAIATLDGLAADAAAPQLYRDLAAFKSISAQIGTTDAATLLARVEPLAVPGATFALLAREQKALIQIDAGDTAAALETLKAILADQGVTQGLRSRVTQVIVAIGGTVDN